MTRYVPVAAAGLVAAFAALQVVDAMQTMQIISPWQNEQIHGLHEPLFRRKFSGGEGNPLLRWWMDPDGMEPFVVGPYDEPEAGELAWDPDRADSIWRVRSRRIVSFKAVHTVAICGAACLLGSTLSPLGPSWEVVLLGVANAISVANVGRNYWCGLPLSGPGSHAVWVSGQCDSDEHYCGGAADETRTAAGLV